MKFGTEMKIHGNLLGVLSGIEGWLISQNKIPYAIALGVVLGIYGNFLAHRITKKVKQMLLPFLMPFLMPNFTGKISKTPPEHDSPRDTHP